MMSGLWERETRQRTAAGVPQLSSQPGAVLVGQPPTFIEGKLVPGLPVLIDDLSGDPAAA